LPASWALRVPSFTAADNSAFMLVAGITSLEERCVAVENGLTGSNGAALVLEPCTSAVAAGDGRELWSIGTTGQLFNVASKKCAVAARGDTNASMAPRVFLGECTDVASGTGQCEVLPNGQVRFGVGNQEPTCLSQRGAAPEQANVALGAAVAASSTLDVSVHGAALALDGCHSTYWASELGVSDPVAFRIDFGTRENLVSLNIMWEFPAQDFSIALSDIGSHWVEVFATDTNFAKTNVVRLEAKPATALRLNMRAPHSIHGYINGQSIYGIRSIEAFAWGMHSILDMCGDAMRNDDARDKYFAVHANGYDFGLAEIVHSELPSLTVASSSLAAVISQINMLHSRVADCRSDLSEQALNTTLPRRPKAYKDVALQESRHRSAGAIAISSKSTDYNCQLADASNALDLELGIDQSTINSFLDEARHAIVSIRASLL